MTTTTLVAPISYRMTSSLERNEPRAHGELLQLSRTIKGATPRYTSTLSGKFIALIFEKPSLRTRVTFEVGIQSMGARSFSWTTTQASASLVRANPLPMSQGISSAGYRASSRACTTSVSSNKWPRTQNIPVINAPSDKFHPAGAGRFLHLEEKFGALRGFKLAYVGDGNNVCSSLIYLAARLGVHLRIATPAEYAPVPEVRRRCRRVARETKA